MSDDLQPPSIEDYLEAELKEAIDAGELDRIKVLQKQLDDLDDDIERMLEPPAPTRCNTCNDHPRVAIKPRDCAECGSPIDEFAQPVAPVNYYEDVDEHGAIVDQHHH